ncbi:hypothetical protein ACFX1X_032699 [Malus domestica]
MHAIDVIQMNMFFTNLPSATGQDTSLEGYTGIEFWFSPKLATLLTKQGEYIKTWKCHWFVLKQDKLFWFKDSHRTHSSTPNDVIPVGTCLTVKGAEDVVHKPSAFKLQSCCAACSRKP